MSSENYFVYITTNPKRKVLYTGVTNDLYTRILQHYENRGNTSSFAGRYYCYVLIYYERFSSASLAIEREKEIKDMSREEKESLIDTMNPKRNRHNRIVVGLQILGFYHYWQDPTRTGFLLNDVSLGFLLRGLLHNRIVVGL